MLKKFFAVLAIAIAGVGVLCWIYLPSITRYRELKSEEERLSQKIREIDQQIKVLADERNLLQTDVAYLEKVIREELGFVKPGEIIYELVTKKNPSNASLAAPEAPVTSEAASVSRKTSMSPLEVAGSIARTAPKAPQKKASSSPRQV